MAEQQTSSQGGSMIMETDDEMQRRQQEQNQAGQKPQLGEEEEGEKEEKQPMLPMLMQQEEWQQQEEESQGVEGSILARAGLSLYDPEEAKEEFKRMEERVVILSKREFKKAVHDDNYQLIFDSMRSGHLPDVDMAKLFLSAARHGMKDMALLLANQVPDLTVRDSWGENALTMAAKRGDITFAYGLLRLGLPLNTRNGVGQTAYEVSGLYINRPFRKFCKNFSLAHNVPLA